MKLTQLTPWPNIIKYSHFNKFHNADDTAAQSGLWTETELFIVKLLPSFLFQHSSNSFQNIFYVNFVILCKKHRTSVGSADNMTFKWKICFIIAWIPVKYRHMATDSKKQNLPPLIASNFPRTPLRWLSNLSTLSSTHHMAPNQTTNFLFAIKFSIDDSIVNETIVHKKV